MDKFGLDHLNEPHLGAVSQLRPFVQVCGLEAGSGWVGIDGCRRLRGLYLERLGLPRNWDGRLGYSSTGKRENQGREC